MTLRMADAIDPLLLPDGFDAYAGYPNGSWPDYNAIVNKFPGKFYVDLSVYLANIGNGLDVEPGDAYPSQFPTYLGLRLAAGVWRPVGYASISMMPELVAFASGVGYVRSQYRLLSAHGGAGRHICGPGTCAYNGANTPQCDGTQWGFYGGYDESLLADDFFLPKGPYVAVAPVSSEPRGSDLLHTFIFPATNSVGDGWIHTTIEWGKFKSISMNGSDPDTDKSVWPGYAKVQNRGGFVEITVKNFIPGASGAVFVLATP